MRQCKRPLERAISSAIRARNFDLANELFGNAVLILTSFIFTLFRSFISCSSLVLVLLYLFFSLFLFFYTLTYLCLLITFNKWKPILDLMSNQLSIICPSDQRTYLKMCRILYTPCNLQRSLVQQISKRYFSFIHLFFPSISVLSSVYIDKQHMLLVEAASVAFVYQVCLQQLIQANDIFLQIYWRGVLTRQLLCGILFTVLTF